MGDDRAKPEKTQQKTILSRRIAEARCGQKRQRRLHRDERDRKNKRHQVRPPQRRIPQAQDRAQWISQPRLARLGANFRGQRLFELRPDPHHVDQTKAERHQRGNRKRIYAETREPGKIRRQIDVHGKRADRGSRHETEAKRCAHQAHRL